MGSEVLNVEVQWVRAVDQAPFYADHVVALHGDDLLAVGVRCGCLVCVHDRLQGVLEAVDGLLGGLRRQLHGLALLAELSVDDGRSLESEVCDHAEGDGDEWHALDDVAVSVPDVMRACVVVVRCMGGMWCIVTTDSLLSRVSSLSLTFFCLSVFLCLLPLSPSHSHTHAHTQSRRNIRIRSTPRRLQYSHHT